MIKDIQVRHKLVQKLQSHAHSPRAQTTSPAYGLPEQAPFLLADINHHLRHDSKITKSSHSHYKSTKQKNSFAIPIHLLEFITNKILKLSLKDKTKDKVL